MNTWKPHSPPQTALLCLMFDKDIQGTEQILASPQSSEDEATVTWETSNSKTESCRVGQESTRKKKFPNETRILETHNRFDRKHPLTKQAQANVTPKLLIIGWLRNESELCKLMFRFLIWIRYRGKFLLTSCWNTLLLSYEDCLYVFENLYSLSLIFVWNS